MVKWFIGPLVWALQFPSAWATEIPRGLSASDRLEVTRVLGTNSSTKLLSNPYPLGGYQGLEFGISVDFIDTTELLSLGCSPGSAGCTNEEPSQTNSQLRFSRLSLAKGLYKDVDIYCHFSPPNNQTGLSEFGGALRWSFYQAVYFPANVSLVGHTNRLNFADTFSGQNLGAQLMLGIHVENVALYLAGGYLTTSGVFVGGLDGEGRVDPSDPELSEDNLAKTSLTEFHSLVGISFHFGNYFLAGQIDRYKDNVYSAKIGLRL